MNPRLLYCISNLREKNNNLNRFKRILVNLDLMISKETYLYTLIRLKDCKWMFLVREIMYPW